MNMQGRLEGAAQLAAVLRAMPERLAGQTMTRLLREAAEPIRARWEDNAHRGLEAPHMRDHIVISAVQKISDVGDARFEKTERAQDASGRVVEHAVAVGPSKDFFYAFFQEFGTTRHPAKPHAREAFDAGVGEAFVILQNGIWIVLRSGARA
jgi:HK97 gp10 family phage protein